MYTSCHSVAKCVRTVLILIPSKKYLYIFRVKVIPGICVIFPFFCPLVGVHRWLNPPIRHQVFVGDPRSSEFVDHARYGKGACSVCDDIRSYLCVRLCVFVGWRLAFVCFWCHEGKLGAPQRPNIDGRATPTSPRRPPPPFVCRLGWRRLATTL